MESEGCSVEEKQYKTPKNEFIVASPLNISKILAIP